MVFEPGEAVGHDGADGILDPGGQATGMLEHRPGEEGGFGHVLALGLFGGVFGHEAAVGGLGGTPRGTGGMGFVEETGAAQHYRDARILAIYEGTNGIQSIDLVMRKLPLAGGETVKASIARYRAAAEARTT